MKKYLFIATALAALASCSSDDIVGDNSQQTLTSEQAPISFGSFTAAVTRADHIGSDAAGLLNNNFVVYGFKGNGTTKETVFDHYNVNWANNTANTTTSNTSDWEYVAQTKHALASTAAQSIKYWDYATTQYDFIAWSNGTGTAVFAAGDYDKDANILVTKTTPTSMTSSTGGAYTVKGKAENLAKFYIADLITAYRNDGTVENSDYQKQVTIKFRALSAKVRVALYETVPGYSVKDVVFYTDASTVATDGEAHLYTTDTDVFNEEGTFTVYYPTVGSDNKLETDYNKAHLAFTAETDGTAKVKNFGALDLTNTAQDKQIAEATGKVYLGRASDEATYAGVNTTANPNYYTIVIPNETGAVLNLKVNYKLLSTDGSGEVINVTGATAQVPAQFAKWMSGYAYTYIFKISQNTNGVTNPSAGPAGLYPITFDAIVTETEDGVQETITTVATPSITTYAKGAIVTDNDEYTTGSNIYVVVSNDGTALAASNSKLYTVTLEDGAAQTINEASVANAIKNGGDSSPFVVTDANGKKMTVTDASGLTFPGKIAAADAPDGNEITVNCAKFTPAEPTYDVKAVETGDPVTGLYIRTGDGTTTPYEYTEITDENATADSGTTYCEKNSSAGIYVFEYTYTESATEKKAYKIIKVVD